MLSSLTRLHRTTLKLRASLIRQRTRHIQRLQKTLEGVNIKLDSVIADIVGMSGRGMIEALIAGQTDPAKLAALANYRIKASPQPLREALRGRAGTPIFAGWAWPPPRFEQRPS
jgi:transposase